MPGDFAARARAQLRELLLSSGLSIRELASAFGVSSRTIERHLRGRSSSRERRSWYQKVRSVRVDDDGNIHIVVRYTAPTRKPADWSRETREAREHKKRVG